MLRLVSKPQEIFNKYRGIELQAKSQNQKEKTNQKRCVKNQTRRTKVHKTRCQENTYIHVNRGMMPIIESFCKHSLNPLLCGNTVSKKTNKFKSSQI